MTTINVIDLLDLSIALDLRLATTLMSEPMAAGKIADSRAIGRLSSAIIKLCRTGDPEHAGKVRVAWGNLSIVAQKSIAAVARELGKADSLAAVVGALPEPIESLPPHRPAPMF